MPLHLFLLRGNSQQCSKALHNFKERNFTIYDHEYPCKLAAPLALRQNVAGMPKVDSSQVSLVSRRICDILLTTYGPTHLSKEFWNWFKHQKHQTDRIVIVGVPADRMWDGPVEYFKRQSKITVLNYVLSDRDIMNEIDRQVMR